MGLTWAVVWFLAGFVLWLVVGPDRVDLPFPVGFPAFGFLAGTAFSGVLGFAERRRRFDEMSVWRFSSWGAAGSLLFYGTFVVIATLAGERGALQAVPLLGPVFALAGAGSAAGVLALARRAEDEELLEDGAQALGLTEAAE